MEAPRPATRGSTKLKRKPFSDLTNTPSLSSPNPKSKPNPKPGYVPEPETSDPQPLPVPSTSGDQENDWDQQGTPLKFKEVSADLCPETLFSSDCVKDLFPPGFYCNNADNNDEAKISTVYTRLKARRKLKGKVIKSAPSLSCPPVGKNRSIEGSMRLKGDDADLCKSFSVPLDIAKKKKLYKEPEPVQKPILPGDFVEKQRAYFAEIDAYELPVEEVSDDDEVTIK